jgi:hypothetical protein
VLSNTSLRGLQDFRCRRSQDDDKVVVTCPAFPGPAETSDNGSDGQTRSHEEDLIFRRTNGQDPARGGRGPGGRGREEARGQRRHDLCLALVIRQARGGGREASATDRERERAVEEIIGEARPRGVEVMKGVAAKTSRRASTMPGGSRAKTRRVDRTSIR